MSTPSLQPPPQPPKLTPAEIEQEVQLASGRGYSLGSLRRTLPVARTRHTRAPEPTASDAVEGPPPAGFDPAGGVLGAAPPATELGGVELAPAEREQVIDQALLMLEDLYAHLPLKRALHAIDPIQRLRLLRLRHAALDEREFQSEMIDIFVSLRDLHTNYQLPRAYWSQVAYLPFRVEEFYDPGDTDHRRYLVSRVSPRNTDPGLQAGLEITHWNGTPIDLAVARNAAREAGSNPEARRCQGLVALTLRWFGASLPPDEDWVTLTFAGGAEVRVAWEVITPAEVRNFAFEPDQGVELATALALDVRAEVLRRVRKGLFDGEGIRAEKDMRAYRANAEAPPANAPTSIMPDVYPRFGTVSPPSGSFGYVRLATFMPPKKPGGSYDVDGAVAEFVRILRTLPPDGLILDVRGNGGGIVWFGERILQTMSPQKIVPEPFQFVSTPFTHRIASALPWLQQWADPLATALSTGAGFSQGFPITPVAACNDIGQIYQGPVVLITDALCYSTTDIFAAGFQDHAIGDVLGCHDNTGAGGANVWDYRFLQDLQIDPNPFVALPGETSMRVAVRRSTRIGDRAGVPLEDLGVAPDARHHITRDDLLRNNVDLIARAGEMLAAKARHTLAVAFPAAAPHAQIRIESTGIDRVDLQASDADASDRPLLSADVTTSPLDVNVPRPVTSGTAVTAFGYWHGAQVVSIRATAP